jgi:hypothetical protein
MTAIYSFQSSTQPGLCAFAGDAEGTRLPDRLGPWVAIGSVGAGEAIPHALDRDTIEDAIGTAGFQLWRMKRTAAPAEPQPASRQRLRNTRG